MDYHFTKKICMKICEDAVDIMFQRGISYGEAPDRQANITHLLADIRKMCDLLEKNANHW